MLRLIGRFLRPAAALALTGYVLWRANPRAVLAAMASADPAWIGVAAALVLVDRTLMAYRAIALLCPIDAASRPPVRDVIRVFFVSTFVGTFLPASVGGDAVRAYGLSQLRVTAGAAVASVLMDRLLGVISILFVGLVGLATSGVVDTASTRAIGLSLLLAGAVSLGASLVVFSERAAGLAHALVLRVPVASLRRIGADLALATRAYHRHHGDLALVLAGSIGVQVLRVVQAYCLGRSLQIDAQLAVYFGLVPLILLVMLLPVSINGIGPSQVAFVWFFGRAGVHAADAFALSVLFVALGVVGNLPGGWLYATGPSREARR